MKFNETLGNMHTGTLLLLLSVFVVMLILLFTSVKLTGRLTIENMHLEKDIKECTIKKNLVNDDYTSLMLDNKRIKQIMEFRQDYNRSAYVTCTAHYLGTNFTKTIS